MTLKLLSPETKKRFPSVSIFVLLVVALFLPIVYFQVIGFKNDYFYHIEFAKEIVSNGGEIGSPHFLFQILIIGAKILIPAANYSTLGILIGVLCYVVLGLILYELIYSSFGGIVSFRSEIISITLAIVMMLVTPIFLFISWFDHHYIYGYLNPGNIYHNPTLQLIKPLSVLLNLIALRIFIRQDQQRTSVILIIVSGVLSILSAIAKPSYIICLLPVLLIFSVFRVWHRKTLDWKLMIFGFVLPIVVVLIWQYTATYSSTAVTAVSARIIFAPFVVFSHSSSNLLLKFILSILFPLSVYLGYFKKSIKDIDLNFTWLVFIVGAFYSYFLAEDGERLYDGNFVWSGQITLFVLFVMSARFFVSQNTRTFLGEAIRKPEKIFLFCLSVLSMHLICGLVWYFVNTPLSSINPWLLF